MATGVHHGEASGWENWWSPFMTQSHTTSHPQADILYSSILVTSGQHVVVHGCKIHFVAEHGEGLGLYQLGE